jgi:ABC-type nitrate/sulfonate/bicarbonate transport system permease component
MTERKEHWGYRLLAVIIIPSILGIIVNRIDRHTESSPLLKTVDRFVSAFADGQIYKSLLETMWRFGLGFSIALICAVVVGILMGRFRRAENALIDSVRLLRPIPSAAIIPLAMLFFSGIGNTLRIFVISYGVFWPLLIHVYQASKEIDQTLIDTGYTLGKGRLKIFWDIELKAVQPAILAGSRIGLAIGMLLAVTSEIIVPGDPSGIGYLILDFERSFRQPEMLTAIVVLALAGWLLDWGFKWAEPRLLPWHIARTQRL